MPRPGQVLGLVGTNGIGKSTALKILAGKDKPNLGRFDVRSAPPQTSSAVSPSTDPASHWPRNTGLPSGTSWTEPSGLERDPGLLSRLRVAKLLHALAGGAPAGTGERAAWSATGRAGVNAKAQRGRTAVPPASRPTQALIKPQYVDNISKVVKGNVELTLKGKDQLNNMDAMVDALGTRLRDLDPGRREPSLTVSPAVTGPVWRAAPDLRDVLGRDIGDLSGGELQRFAIAMTCVQKADMSVECAGKSADQDEGC